MNTPTTWGHYAFALLTISLLVGCLNDSTSTIKTDEVLRLEFAAINSTLPVGQQEVSQDVCGTKLTDVGTGYDATFNFLGFYVSDIQLVTTSGERLPVTLDDNLSNQVLGYDHAGKPAGVIAAIDLLNKNQCGSRTKTPWREISGTYSKPANTEITGLEFSLGLPATINHAEPHATGPLARTSVAAMHWGWMRGYVFLTYELRANDSATGNPLGNWVLHLGSIECDWQGEPEASAVNCGVPNRPLIKLDGFTPGTSRIAVNLAELLQDSTPATCMSEVGEPCAERFARLGLIHPTQSGTEPIQQILFSTLNP